MHTSFTKRERERKRERKREREKERDYVCSDLQYYNSIGYYVLDKYQNIDPIWPDNPTAEIKQKNQLIIRASNNSQQTANQHRLPWEFCLPTDLFQVNYILKE